MGKLFDQILDFVKGTKICHPVVGVQFSIYIQRWTPYPYFFKRGEFSDYQFDIIEICWALSYQGLNCRMILSFFGNPI